MHSSGKFFSEEFFPFKKVANTVIFSQFSQHYSYFKKFRKNFKKSLHFPRGYANINKSLGQRVLSRQPGVAKFGIALEWGSRGPEFESRHSDQTMISPNYIVQMGNVVRTYHFYRKCALIIKGRKQNSRPCPFHSSVIQLFPNYISFIFRIYSAEEML